MWEHSQVCLCPPWCAPHKTQHPQRDSMCCMQFPVHVLGVCATSTCPCCWPSSCVSPVHARLTWLLCVPPGWQVIDNNNYGVKGWLCRNEHAGAFEGQMQPDILKHRNPAPSELVLTALSLGLFTQLVHCACPHSRHCTISLHVPCIAKRLLWGNQHLTTAPSIQLVKASPHCMCSLSLSLS